MYVEDKGVCSLGIFKDKEKAAITVARVKAKRAVAAADTGKTCAKAGCAGGVPIPPLACQIPFCVFFEEVLKINFWGRLTHTLVTAFHVNDRDCVQISEQHTH